MRGSSARRTAVLLTVVAVAASVCAAVPADATTRSSSVDLVVTVPGATPTKAQVQRAVTGLKVASVRSLGDGLAAVEVRGSGTAAQQAAALERSPLVGEAAPDRRFTAAVSKAPVLKAPVTTAPISAPDPWFSDQWDLWDARSTVRAGGFGVDAPRAWTKTTGDPEVVVAVLDTGITRHPDLQGASILPGYDFVTEVDGVDTGDGDGWDADPTDAGDACAELDQDSTWHGTFVAGEIVAQRGKAGVVGQAPRVSVVPVRVLGGCGGSEADTIAAIGWASGGDVDGVPTNPHPAQVISMSLGSSTGACSDALQIAVDDAIDRGTVIVAAAGNDGSTMGDTSPANCAGVVSVVATTRTGALAGYSNRGDASITPFIAAPGGSDANPIIGDVWSSSGAFSAAGNKAVIAADQGTSMATPRVAAAIALLLSIRPGLDPAEVMQRLTATVTPFPAGSSCTKALCGDGIVNAGDLVGAKQVLLQTAALTTSGGVHVGGRLVAAGASWRPSPDRVTFRWLRDGRPIAGATARTYVLRSADGGHRIAVRAQAQRAQTVTAVATSAARRVPRGTLP